MRRHIAVAVAACAAIAVAAPAAQAKKPRHGDFEKLERAVKLKGLTDHLEAFQAIADANGGNRATGQPGYDASVDYVIQRLRKAGYDVSREPFNYPVWNENTPAELTWNGTTYSAEEPADLVTFGFSPSGELEDLPIVATNDIVIHSGPTSVSTSGCEATDFPAAVDGAIALIQRGTCPFVQKLANAEAAGAAGVILFNEGNTPDRVAPSFIEAPADLSIPAVYVSATIGKAIYAALPSGEQTASLTTDTTVTPRYFDNVVAYSRSGDPNNTVMLGAHLDSVEEGPGVNDNGSGSSALLEIAEQMDKLGANKTKGKGGLVNRVAFAFWGAEESGLIGSTYFVENLSDAEKADILANLNFDMLASPNFARLVYDGDGSSFDLEGPPGSDIIEYQFNRHFEDLGLAYEATEFSGRSDYGPFIAAGIAAGGLFSGAEEPKTAEQVQRYGGVEGAWLDPCYHQACDNLDTVFGTPPLDADGLEDLDDPAAAAAALDGNGLVGFDQLADAAAHTTWYMTTRRNPLNRP